jgi:hypothetical protein
MVHRPDLDGQPVTKHVKLQVPYGTITSSSLVKEGTYDGSKGRIYFKISLNTGERIESTGFLTHLYRWHDEVRSQ